MLTLRSLYICPCSQRNVSIFLGVPIAIYWTFLLVVCARTHTHTHTCMEMPNKSYDQLHGKSDFPYMPNCKTKKNDSMENLYGKHDMTQPIDDNNEKIWERQIEWNLNMRLFMRQSQCVQSNWFNLIYFDWWIHIGASHCAGRTPTTSSDLIEFFITVFHSATHWTGALNWIDVKEKRQKDILFILL